MVDYIQNGSYGNSKSLINDENEIFKGIDYEAKCDQMKDPTLYKKLMSDTQCKQFSLRFLPKGERKFPAKIIEEHSDFPVLSDLYKNMNLSLSIPFEINADVVKAFVGYLFEGKIKINIEEIFELVKLLTCLGSFDMLNEVKDFILNQMNNKFLIVFVFQVGASTECLLFNLLEDSWFYDPIYSKAMKFFIMSKKNFNLLLSLLDNEFLSHLTIKFKRVFLWKLLSLLTESSSTSYNPSNIDKLSLVYNFFKLRMFDQSEEEEKRNYIKNLTENFLDMENLTYGDLQLLKDIGILTIDELNEKEISLMRRQIIALNKDKQDLLDRVLTLTKENSEMAKNLGQVTKDLNEQRSLNDGNSIRLENMEKLVKSLAVKSSMSFNISELVFPGSNFLSYSEINFLKICLGYPRSFNQIFNSNIDGDKAETFHLKCDNRSGTLVVVQADNGSKFGGFTSLNWIGHKVVKENDSLAFLFQLDLMRKFHCVDIKNVIFCDKYLCSVFGKGYDLEIPNNFFRNFSKSTLMSYGTKDELQGFDSKTVLAGGNKFKVKHLEVYEILLG